MKTENVLVFFRMTAASIFAIGAIYLMAIDKSGGGWCIIAAVILGAVELSKSE